MANDMNSMKKKMKDPNFQNVNVDTGDEMMGLSPEEMMKLAQERAKRKKMDKMMNRHTLYGDKYGFTDKARKNLANDDRY